jgi:hypothetical protein
MSTVISRVVVERANSDVRRRRIGPADRHRATSTIMSDRHLRSCTLCEAMCGIVIESDRGRITSIRAGDRNHGRDDARIGTLTGNAGFSGVPVRVVRA